MKKQFMAIIGLLLTLSMAMTGCSGSSASSDSSLSEESNPVSSSQAASQVSEDEDNIPGSGTAELTVQFGDAGEVFVMHLEDNCTAAAAIQQFLHIRQRLPLYCYPLSA